MYDTNRIQCSFQSFFNFSLISSLGLSFGLSIEYHILKCELFIIYMDPQVWNGFDKTLYVYRAVWLIVLPAWGHMQLIATVVGISAKHSRCIAKLLIIRLLVSVSALTLCLTFSSFSGGQFNNLVRRQKLFCSNGLTHF